MGNSWGHAIERLPDETAAYYASRGAQCSAGKCREAVTHVTTYRYHTGRSFRVTDASRNVCPGHAVAFAAKHKLALP